MRISDGVMCPPEKGWANTVFVVVLTTSKGDGVGQTTEGVDAGAPSAGEGYEAPPATGSLDTGKRKLEDQEGPRASKNPRSHSPENYVGSLESRGNQLFFF